MRVKTSILLIAALLLGFLIRIYKVDTLAMYGDELTMVYDTYSILKTGMDATGEKLPLTFSMGAGRPAGYVYFSLPFVAIFGPTALGVRALSVLSGLGVILLVYLLGKRIFSARVGIIASFLAAIMPWEMYLSRAGFEAHFAVFLALLGIVAFIYAANKRWFYILWAVAWGVTIHTYPTFKMTLPLLLPIILWYTKSFKKIISNKYFLLGLVIFFVFGILSARENLKGRSEERFLRLNIFADKQLKEEIIQKVNYERTISTLPDIVKPIFYNKPFEYSYILLNNYSKSLSADFLLLKGDGNPRHNPGEMGMLYLVDGLVLFVAVVNMWKADKRTFVLLVSWIAIVPLATMFLPETHGLRNSFMLPAFLILSAYGFSRLNRWFATLFGIFVVVQLIFILQRIYFLAPPKFASFWSEPAKKATELAIRKKGQYNTIYLSDKIDNIEYAYPVYGRIDPSVVINQYNKFPKKFDNIEIVNTDKISKKDDKILIIDETQL